MIKKQDQRFDLYLDNLFQDRQSSEESVDSAKLEGTGLTAETELDYLFSHAKKYPLLKPREERELTAAIFHSKIRILTKIAATEPIFNYYLREMVDAGMISSEDDDGSGEEKKVPNFSKYLNSEKSADGIMSEFPVFKKQVKLLINRCTRVQYISDPKQLKKAEEKISDLLAKINFSWSQFQKDGLFQLVEKDDLEMKAFRRNFQIMFNHNLRLALQGAKHYFPMSLNRADLIQEANRGLMISIERFDYRRGYKFSTYATPWIRQRVHRFATQYFTIRVPVYLTEKIGKMKTLSRGNPTWDDEQIAEEMGVSIEYIKELRLASKRTQTVSIDEPLKRDSGEEGGDSLGAFLTDPDADVEKSILVVITNDQIISMMKQKLTTKEYEVLAWHLGLEDRDEKTLEEIGLIYHVTRERIRQIESKALMKLRAMNFFQQLRI